MSASHLHSGCCHPLPLSRGGGVGRWHGLSKQRFKTSAIAAPEKEAEIYSTPSGNGNVPKGLNKYSGKVTQPKSQGASQAMLYATGLSESDMDKPQVREHYVHAALCGRQALIPPSCNHVCSLQAYSAPACPKFRKHALRFPYMQVGISSVWYEGNPCNMHLMDLASDVKRGVEEAGLHLEAQLPHLYRTGSPDRSLHVASCCLVKLLWH